MSISIHSGPARHRSAHERRSWARQHASLATMRRYPTTITVETTVAAPIDDVWRAWTTPGDITQWNTASDDWHTTSEALDLRVGGAFSSRMEAKDGTMGFDVAGTYTRIVPHAAIEYSLGKAQPR